MQIPNAPDIDTPLLLALCRAYDEDGAAAMAAWLAENRGAFLDALGSEGARFTCSACGKVFMTGKSREIHVDMKHAEPL